MLTALIIITLYQCFFGKKDKKLADKMPAFLCRILGKKAV
jgi:hypothetical protein